MDTSTTAIARCDDHALLHERTQAWSSLDSPRPYDFEMIIKPSLFELRYT